MSIFISMLFTLQCIYWIVGKRASKENGSLQDYFLAGKSVKTFPLMMTFFATQVGGGIFLGATEEAYRFGWPVLFYPLGAALGLILLGSGIGKKLAGFKVTTVAELFEQVYGSQVLRKVASMLSVVSLFLILAAQYVASSKFLVSMGLTSTPLFLLFWGIIIYYTVQGGLKAVISTDLVQAGFFSAALFVCFAVLLYNEPSAGSLNLPSLEQFSSVSGKLTGWLLMPLLFMVIEQDMAQRCFAGASPQTVSKASLLAGLATLAVCFVPVFIGVLAQKMELTIAPGSSVLMETIALTTNPWITALIGFAVLAAIISTATSLINAISSNLASDFKLSNSIQSAKWLTCGISVGALIAAFGFNNIVDLLIQSYELSVACLFVPIVFALLKKDGCYEAALGSILLGALGCILFRYVETPFPREVSTLLLSFAGFWIGKWTTFLHVKYTR